MSKINGLDPEDNLYMIVETARGALDDASARSSNGRDAIESIQNDARSIAGLGKGLKGAAKGAVGKGGGGGGGGGGKL